MAKVTERCFEATGADCFLCDFSPPRSGDPASIVIPDIPADFIAVACNPGRAVRANSAILAGHIKTHTGRDVTFTLVTRDMNKLAVESLLLGAQLLGLENVIVAQGDPFSPRDLERVKHVGDYTPTSLIASIASMNAGADFRGSRLRSPADFCIGATLDLTRELCDETLLARRKLDAGADFLITQPIFDPVNARRFLDAYADHSGEEMAAPVFFGLQVLKAGGVLFSSIPESVRRELDQGRDGVEIALELYERFRKSGIRNVYLVPPIARGGARDYRAAQQFLAAVGRETGIAADADTG